MNLFSQESIKKSPLMYVYILMGGLGGLLMAFLIRHSLPLNQQRAKEYHQDIEVAKQDIFNLEIEISQSIHENNRSASEKLDFRLSEIKRSFSKLEKIPTFFSQQRQNILSSKLETQAVLFSTQEDLVQQLIDTTTNLNNSCQYIFKLKKDTIQSPEITDNLLKNAILYCYQENGVTKLSIETQLKKINNVFESEKLIGNNFLLISLAEHVNKILLSRQKINKIHRQLNESSLKDRLLEFDILYLENLNSIEKRIQIYRLFCFLFFVIAIIFVAYQVINKLTQTNRNIVKILEGFTQELETKVEQRTALLEESIQNTEAALAQAQNANKAKSRFLANMSHELRTPLNAILGFTQLMCRDSSVSAEHQENVQIINRSGEHLLKLINDILEMSKIEVGQITLNEVKFDLYTMLKSIEEMLRLKVEAKKVTLAFDIAKNVPQYIYTDEGKLRQIIINLLGNALKFTQKGQIALKVELKDNVQLEEANIEFLFTDTFLLNFTVTDTGPGIAEEEMNQLFSPFEQTKIGRISNEGTGLGLSICQKFVELMGGKLEVTSTVGKGSSFSFGIVIKLDDINVSQTEASQAIEEVSRVVGIASDQPEYRILAVDDVSASRLLLKKMLTKIGFAVEEAGDGQQAVDLFLSWHPNLILMDMRMPVMDGYEATRQIKSLPKGKETVIIALTASAFEEERVIILSAGCDDFMRKPFYEAELVKKIGQYLNIDYLYEEKINVISHELETSVELSYENLQVMSEEWRSQLYDAAARVDNQEILQLLSDIPQEYESLAKGLENLVEHFRCDKIIDLTKAAN